MFRWTTLRGDCGRLLITICLFAIQAARADDFHPSPNFNGDQLPTPPQQKAAWLAPKTSLPPTFLSTTTALFDQGLADPRGLEYREVEFGTGDVWRGDGGIVKTHAWIFPPTAPNNSQRFAVAWNGLVYPALSVGKKADLKADIAALDENARKSGVGSATGAVPESESVSYSGRNLLRPCLLLRLGETESAERIWKDLVHADPNDRNADDPYLEIAGHWLFARFDRAVCAHMRGDDRLSLVDCKSLVPTYKAVVAEGIRRKAIAVDEGGKPTEDSAAPTFLDAVPLLLADERRRVAEGPRKLALDLGRETFKSKTEWIAALVRDLDQVSLWKEGQPGEVSLEDDPVVAALVAEKDDAVEPLLKSLQEDTRLTRSVHFNRDFSPYRSLIGAHEAAYVALCNILQESFFEITSTGEDLSSGGMEGRRAVASRMRAYWNQFHGLSMEERWYRILVDDKQHPQRWDSAAMNITRAQDVTFTPASMFAISWMSVPDRKPGEVVKLCGEALRKKANPSVTELLVKRLQEREAAQGDDAIAEGALRQSVGLAQALAAWDGKAHLAELKQFCEYLTPRLRAGGQLMWNTMRLTEMCAIRARLGDAGALDEMAAFLRNAGPGGLDVDAYHLFDDMWQFPDEPVIQKLATELFDGPKSPWNPIIRPDHLVFFSEAHLIPSPLLGFAGFRKQMLRMLADTSLAGAGTIRGDGAVDVQSDLFKINADRYFPEDRTVPKPGTRASFRVCDMYAYYLGGAVGLPLTNLWWPLEQRDAAVKRCQELLTRYGDNFKYSPQRIGQPDQAHIRFAPLDRPADSQEVEAGRAIFSFVGNGAKVRTCKLPAYPTWGNWMTLKEHYIHEKKLLREGDYDGSGTIWQAEEVLENGKWRRYYGFVGNHDVVKVPAEEIELLLPFEAQWKPLSHQISCAVVTPAVDYTQHRGTTHINLSDAVPIIVALGNRRGLTQTTPTAWYEANSQGRPALRPGVSLKLSYARKTNLPDGVVWYVDPADKNYAELPAKIGGVWRPDPSERDLEAGAAFEAMRFDLRDWFDLSRPGSYRLQIVFQAGQNGFTEGSSNIVQFTLTAPSDVQK